MKLHLAVLAVLALPCSLPAAATEPAACTTTVCTASLVPGAQAANLPLAGWIYPAGTTPAVDVVEAPRYGAWDPLTETYIPSANFWKVGIDRFRLQVYGQTDIRTLVLHAAYPVIAEAETMLNAGFGQNVSLAGPGDGSSGGTMGTGGSIIVNPTDPGGGQVQPTEDLRTTIINLANLVRVDFVTEVVDGMMGPSYYEATAINPAFGCASACVLPIVPSTSGSQQVAVFVAPDVWAHPTADRFRVTLRLTKNGLLLSETSLGDLERVPLEGAFNVTAGSLGGDALTLGLSHVEAQRFMPSAEDGAAPSHEAFAGGVRQPFWSQEGTVTTVTVRDEWHSQVDLQNMTNTAKSILVDSRPNAAKRLRLMFDLDLGELSLANNEYMVAFYGQGPALGGTTRSVDLFVRKIGSSYFIRGRSVPETGTTVVTDFLPLVAGTNQIALQYWTANSGNGGGGLRLVVNGVAAELNGLANGQRVVDSVHFGVSSPTLLLNEPGRLLRFTNVTTIAVH